MSQGSFGANLQFTRVKSMSTPWIGHQYTQHMVNKSRHSSESLFTLMHVFELKEETEVTLRKPTYTQGGLATFL